MNTRQTTPISRKAAEQLLDGAAGLAPQGPEDLRGQDPLARVLAAAAAPGRESELAGEDMAVAAFEASHLVLSPLPEEDKCLSPRSHEFSPARFSPRRWPFSPPGGSRSPRAPVPSRAQDRSREVRR